MEKAIAERMKSREIIVEDGGVGEWKGRTAGEIAAAAI